MVLVTYDVRTENSAGARRLRRISKICQDYGQRVQYSVFECLVDPAQWTLMKRQLTQEMEPTEDSLRCYFLGANWSRRVEHIGAKPSYDPEGPLVI